MYGSQNRYFQIKIFTCGSLSADKIALAFEDRLKLSSNCCGTPVRKKTDISFRILICFFLCVGLINKKKFYEFEPQFKRIDVVDVS